jgi:uncharacterized integral membrane protein
MMRVFAFLFLVAAIGAIVILGVQNRESVTLAFLSWSVVAELWMVVGAGYVLGMLSGWSAACVLRRSWHRVMEPGRHEATYSR